MRIYSVTCKDANYALLYVESKRIFIHVFRIETETTAMCHKKTLVVAEHSQMLVENKFY